MPFVINCRIVGCCIGIPTKASFVEHLWLFLMKKVKPFALLLVAQDPRGGGIVTCAPSSSFLIIIPRGLSSALLRHIWYKDLFVLQMDVIVLPLWYKAPTAFSDYIGILG
jgi:hypothetical protein